MIRACKCRFDSGLICTILARSPRDGSDRAIIRYRSSGGNSPIVLQPKQKKTSRHC